jgi:transcription factor IIIB 90 kDa subunit
VCSLTITRRLKEFAQTSAAVLSVDEFEMLDEKCGADPPAYKRARLRDELSQKQTETSDNGMEDEGITDVCAADLNELEETIKAFEFDEGMVNEGVVGNEGVEGGEGGGSGGGGINGVRMGLALPSDSELSADVDQYINTPQEVEIKTQLWYDLNADYLSEQQQKQQQKLDNATQPKPQRKRKSSGKAVTPLTSVGDVMKKKVSTKINYSALEGLFATTPMSSTHTSLQSSHASVNRTQHENENENECENENENECENDVYSDDENQNENDHIPYSPQSDDDWE